MKFEIHSVSAMNEFAEKVASKLKPGNVVELVGDVGSGKTTFTKALAASLGVTDNVQSPTFTISSVYDAANGTRLAHYDFYRLAEPGIMKNELAESVSDNSTITVLEWADTVADVLPSDRLTIRFDYLADEASRLVSVSGPKSHLFETEEGAES